MSRAKFPVLLAKSYSLDPKTNDIPTYARLVPHVRAVARAGESIVEAVGEIILANLNLPLDPWLSRLQRAVNVACLAHDIGKANECFQLMVSGKLDPRKQPARHELLSAILLMNNDAIKEWALEMLTEKSKFDDGEMLLNCVIAAVAGHHLKMDDKWKRASIAIRAGGCGTDLPFLLTHQDLKYLFNKTLLTTEIAYSLMENSDNYLGNQQLPFNLKSKRWNDKLKRDAQWWRFAAVVKALTAAADVAGSAMLPEKENIRKWVQETLSHRIQQQEMQDVVDARLKGNTPRLFQEAIGQSQARITLVEAGCGSGKTAAAYMWAKHHAKDKKLFFCYPTTGTATEGFLGYMHETGIEAALIHSRSIVDLEGLAKVGDEDEEDDTKEDNDHLLRIESLCAWSPKVIICTIDTVLSLVRNNRRGLYNSPALLSSAFVFDELHSYSKKMFEGMIALMKALPGASFLLMSASLPQNRKESLQKAFPQLAEVPPAQKLEIIPRYQFDLRDDRHNVQKLAQDKALAGKRVLWICNTVARAQELFDALQRDDLKVVTYHSRFKYTDRKNRHREVIDSFEKPGGIIAVTTQVAEMSLDLDADLLITEVAPIPSLIQRLGRLNRRISEEKPGTPRDAIFLTVKDSAPYDEKELSQAENWIQALMKQTKPLSQTDLINAFNQLADNIKEELDLHTHWLDLGWFSEPEQVREASFSVSIILPEDEQACRNSREELIKRVIPMNFQARMRQWREFKGNLIAPVGAISYQETSGAK